MPKESPDPKTRIASHPRWLLANPAPAEVVLRLSSIANAILSVLRRIPQLDGKTPSFRDYLHHTTILASYVHESVAVLNRRHGGLAWRLAREGLVRGPLTAADLDELKRLLLPGSTFVATCAEIRKKHGFHVDAARVRGWLHDPERVGRITLLTANSEAPSDWVFEASGQALYDGRPEESRTERFSDQLSVFASRLPLLADAVVCGFAKLPGSNLAYLHGFDSDVVRLEPRMLRSGRIGVLIIPKATSWARFFVGIPARHIATVRPQLCRAVKNDTELENVELLSATSHRDWWIRISKLVVTPTSPLVLVCDAVPGPMIFGSVGGEKYQVVLSPAWNLESMDDFPEPPGEIR